MIARLRSARWPVLVLVLGLSASSALGAPDPGERLIKDCGVNSLYLLLRLQSAEVDLAALRQVLPDTEARGLSMAEIQAASGRHGVTLRGRRIGPGDTPIDRPMIVLLKSAESQGHFVVLEPVGVLGKKVMVLDFPRPARIVDYADLMAGADWTGLALAPMTTAERLGPWIVAFAGVSLVILGLTLPRGRGLTTVWRDRLRRWTAWAPGGSGRRGSFGPA